MASSPKRRRTLHESTSGPDYFAWIPDEIIIQICLLLGARDLTRFAACCHRLRYVTLDGALWERLYRGDFCHAAYPDRVIEPDDGWHNHYMTRLRWTYGHPTILGTERFLALKHSKRVTLSHRPISYAVFGNIPDTSRHRGGGVEFVAREDLAAGVRPNCDDGETCMSGGHRHMNSHKEFHHKIPVWSASTGKFLRRCEFPWEELPGQCVILQCLTISSDLRYVACGASNCKIYVWDLHDKITVRGNKHLLSFCLWNTYHLDDLVRVLDICVGPQGASVAVRAVEGRSDDGHNAVYVHHGVAQLTRKIYRKPFFGCIYHQSWGRGASPFLTGTSVFTDGEMVIFQETLTILAVHDAYTGQCWQRIKLFCYITNFCVDSRGGRITYLGRPNRGKDRRLYEQTVALL